jgi:Glycosyltransferase family 17
MHAWNTDTQREHVPHRSASSLSDWAAAAAAAAALPHTPTRPPARPSISNRLHKSKLFVEQHAHLLAPYQHKLTILTIDAFPQDLQGESQSWDRERYVRDYAHAHIQRKYIDQGTRFVATVADVDEIVSPAFLEALPSLFDELRLPRKVEMQASYYNLNWRVPDGWSKAFVISSEGYKDAGGRMHDVRSRDTHPQGLPPLSDAGGIHCSYCLDVHAIMRKMLSFAHTEYGGAKYQNAHFIKGCLKTGCDILRRGSDGAPWLIRVETDEQLPEVQMWNNQLLFLQEYGEV